MLSDPTIPDHSVARLARAKFQLVRTGQVNRIERAHSHLLDMADTYDAVMPGLFPGALSYRAAMKTVWPRIIALVP